MNAKLFSISLLAAGVLLASASQSNASGYTLTYLGTLGGDYSWVHAINNSGQVVGESNTTLGGTTHATIWNGTIWNGTALHTPTVLGTLGMGPSYASGINAAGQVVGGMTAFGMHYATIWNGTTPTELGDLMESGYGYGGGHPSGINNSGQVVGQSATTTSVDSAMHATIWNGTTPTDLGTLGGNDSVAFGINNASQVVGLSATLGSSVWHPEGLALGALRVLLELKQWYGDSLC